MRMKNKLSVILILFSLTAFFCLFTTSCAIDSSSSSGGEEVKLKIAVILPYKSCSYFTRTADWYLSNLRKALPSSGKNFTLELEWYDEDEIIESSRAEDLAASLANRGDIFAIAGPFSSSCVEIFAEECFKSKKPLFAPVASSENLIRSFAINTVYSDRKIPFLWSLSESDVSQCEALLTKIYALGGRSLSLLSSADLYGKTFYDWIPFMSSDFLLEMKENVRYKSSSGGDSGLDDWGNPPVSLETAADLVMKSGVDYVVCALTSWRDIDLLLNKRESLGDSGPKLLFTDTIFESHVLKNLKADGIEGITTYADPESGFTVAYKSQFGEFPCFGEAQFYDSLLICGFAAAKCLQNEAFNPQKLNNYDTNQVIMNLFASSGEFAVSESSWTSFGMSGVFYNIAENFPVSIRGASGSLIFDENILTSVTSSIYAHWCIVDGAFVMLDYTSSHGTSHTQANRVSWEWSVLFDTNYQKDIDDSTGAGVDYEEADSQWAVIVAASSGWYNYRHQADALYVYQLLKKNGYPDDRIILIMADDIADNPRNKKPGQIYARLNGENLYKDFQIDYRLGELTVKDLQDILLGKHPEAFPDSDVLESGEKSDVLWFWTGHGNNVNGSSENGYLCWSGKELSEYKGFSTSLMKETLEDMSNNHKFRKMLILTESCFSASVTNAIQGIDGVLAISASNGIESSLADIYSVELGVWLSNRFTYNLTSKIEGNSESPLNFSELYRYLVGNTIGSHVTMFNSSNFRNLNLTLLQAFFSYDL